MQTINIKELRDSLNILCKELDLNYNINSGGCCYIAYLIASQLDRLKIRYNLVVYSFCDFDQYDFNQAILNNKNWYTCEHYCLSICRNGFVNRGTGLYDNRYIIRNVNSKHIKWIYKHGSWNDCYNISNNKIIKNIINSFFLKYGRKEIKSL